MSDQLVYMLNVLWFHPDGGAQRYQEYLRAARPLATKYGAHKLDSYLPETTVIGEFDADLVFVVEWPSWKRFLTFVNDPEFKAIRHLREEAIINSLLVRCRKTD